MEIIGAARLTSGQKNGCGYLSSLVVSVFRITEKQKLIKIYFTFDEDGCKRVLRSVHSSSIRHVLCEANMC